MRRRSKPAGQTSRVCSPTKVPSSGEAAIASNYRLNQTAPDRVARTLSARSVTSNATIAALTALWGLLASVTGPRAAIAIAGLLLLATPLLLPRGDHRPQRGRELARIRA
jgi:hypothetical protein